jgi:hypothetical protein
MSVIPQRPYTINFPMEEGELGTNTRIRNYPIPKRGDLFWYHPQPHFVVFDHEFRRPRNKRIWIYTGTQLGANGNPLLRFVDPNEAPDDRIYYLCLNLWEEMGRDFLHPKKRLQYDIRRSIQQIPRERIELSMLYRISLNHDVLGIIAEFLVSRYTLSCLRRSKSIQRGVTISM